MTATMTVVGVVKDFVACLMLPPNADTAYSTVTPDSETTKNYEAALKAASESEAKIGASNLPWLLSRFQLAK